MNQVVYENLEINLLKDLSIFVFLPNKLSSSPILGLTIKRAEGLMGGTLETY